MRDTITVQGAKEHNLKNITVEIPRNQLVVITGVSGSGKSSLAFDTVYAEGQRRFLESMSTFAKKYVAQLKKPNVDFVYGLSPVISIEQKTGVRNPRSTVGTMTDIYDYLRMLYATIGVAHCPYCGAEVPTRSPEQMLAHLLTLPAGTEVEVRAPVFKIYGEDYAYLFDEVRTRGYRRAYIDGRFVDFSEAVDLDEDETVPDRRHRRPLRHPSGQRQANPRLPRTRPPPRRRLHQPPHHDRLTYRPSPSTVARYSRTTVYRPPAPTPSSKAKWKPSTSASTCRPAPARA